MRQVFFPPRGRPGRLRLRDGEVVHRVATLKEMREFAARSCVPIPPATLPDWGLEPAASSWIRLRLPLQPRQEHPHHLYPREEREPKKPRNNVDKEYPEMATLMIWNVPPDVDCEEMRRIFEGVNGIVAVYYSSFRHLILIDFVTRKAAHKARGNLSGRYLMDCPLDMVFFCNEKYVLDRHSSQAWTKPGSSVCIEIRTMLARHFGSSNEGIKIPTNLDGSSIGKAYIKYGSWCHFSEALNLNGSNLGGHKLRVTECDGGSRFWDGHITPDGPYTGKRKVFNDDSEDE